MTYQQLHQKVCKFANVLKRNQIKKGDRIIIYIPMCPEAAIAMLACARLGIIHSVMFGGFSATCAPNWPEPDRFWELIEQYGIIIFYTEPTAACSKKSPVAVKQPGTLRH